MSEPQPDMFVCANCNRPIVLVPAGKHYKWVTDATDKASWHCGSDPRFPVTAHMPSQVEGGLDGP